MAGRKKSGTGTRRRIFNLNSIAMARSMKYRIKYYPNSRNPIYVDLRSPDGHSIHIGHEASGYFVVTSLRGQPLWMKYRLSKSHADELVRKALAGRDIGEELLKRLRGGRR